MQDDFAIRAYKQTTYLDGVVAVTGTSPMELRNIAEEYGRHFQQECNTKTMYEAEEEDGYVAYLFGYWGRWVGACCFRDAMRARISSPTPLILSWVWLHPYFRNNGLLTTAWPQFERQHGKFPILAPLSPAMQVFVKKRRISGKRILQIGEPY